MASRRSISDLVNILLKFRPLSEEDLEWLHMHSDEVDFGEADRIERIEVIEEIRDISK